MAFRRMLVICSTMVLLATFTSAGRDASSQELPDSLQVGETWQGKITQTGVYPRARRLPREMDATFVITENEGYEFKAELREKARDIQVTYIVAGELGKSAEEGSLKIRFKIVDVKESSRTALPVTGVTFEGEFQRHRMEGKWNYPEDFQGTRLSGTFELERQ